MLTGNPGAASIPEQEDDMDNDRKGLPSAATRKEHRLSLDWCTVIVAFALTALVLLGLPAIPW